MHNLNSLALAAASLFATASAQACTQSGGNWYCNQVDAVSYLNFGTSGTYDRVTYMNEVTGECKKDKTAYGGAIGPFDEELSIHIRGPFSLKQFAFYTPASISKRDESGPSRRDLEERALANVACPKANQTTDCAKTTGCTQVSFTPKNKTCYLKSTSAPLHPQDYIRGVRGAQLISPLGNNKATTPKTQPTFTRRSYYNSASQISSGLTFLNNIGGGSFPGIWSPKFGNSLSYASPSGLLPALSPQILSDTVLPSTSEISLFTALPCSPTHPCPYTRPSSVAYHGFSGADKIFLFEFSMPHDYAGADMPALWFLNAQIPRTQQYGGCNCWGNTDGCGELDVFEVLTKGEERMLSSVHGHQAATNPNWFVRPVRGTMKGAVVLRGREMHVKRLDDGFEFGTGLTGEEVEGLVAVGLPWLEEGRVAKMVLPN
ncbi:putative TOS1-like glycosyl hydrolase-domain-containing protein [Elsinoe ampelina]|uniref:glucan endo-1,3-beta-D-glucosidase n=1 Tax=Elsinoe ampelina TaxID=302913 RepID=A0A6A6G7M5_9PEZI|nr:putative TOS1-like glycosyl hydrolase-domain-containing protein [Elsinoe ampelina]